MSIVAIVSSPVKGNTDSLVAAAAEGAEENGKDVKVFHLNAMADKKGCQGCMGCKKVGHCVVKDDLTPVIDAIRKADGIILSTPVYFGEACGQYRMLEDRFFSFLNGDFSLNINAGKKVVVFTSAGSEGADVLADKIAGTMKNCFKCDVVGKLCVVSGNDPKFSSNNVNLLAQAKAWGKKL